MENPGQHLYRFPTKKFLYLLLLAPILFTPASSAYNVPEKIPIQGRLTNASTGVVLSGEYNFTFRIYNASTSGTLLWDENQTLTVDGNGLWNALLGNNTVLFLNFSEDTYLEVELNHDGNPLPRVQLGSAPYAEWTDTAGNLSCTDCLGTDEIEDIYLMNSGDNATGDYMFNGSFTVENSSGSAVLYVNASNGKVGIGTTSPEGKLSVDANVWGSGVNTLDLRNSASASDSNASFHIKFGRVFSGRYFDMIFNTTNYGSMGSQTHFLINRGDTNTNLFAISGDGNVGIGTTTPKRQFIVSAASPVMAFETTGDNLGWGWWSDSSDDSFKLIRYTNTGWTTYSDGVITVETNGNVGIGTTSPIAKLDVARTVTNTVSFNDENSTAGAVVKGTDVNVRLQLGVGGATLGPYAGWIQASYDNVASEGSEPLLLNPRVATSASARPPPTTTLRSVPARILRLMRVRPSSRLVHPEPIRRT